MRRVILALGLAACGDSTSTGEPTTPALRNMTESGVVDSLRLAAVDRFTDFCQTVVTSDEPAVLSNLHPEQQVRAYVWWSDATGAFRDCETVAVEFRLQSLMGTPMSFEAKGPQTGVVSKQQDGVGTAILRATVDSVVFASLTVQQTD